MRIPASFNCHKQASGIIRSRQNRRLFMQFCKHRQRSITNDAGGFTLIELALVIAITGLLAGTYLPLANIWMNYKRQSITKDHIQEIREAMKQYMIRNGHYPCPGPRVDVDTDYPFAETCVLHANDIGSARKRGVYSIAVDGEESVVEGGVPYMRMNIPRSVIFDGWGNLFTYAVTSGLTNRKSALTNMTMNNSTSNNGAIAIINRSGKSIIKPPRSALWAIVSHGRDGSGAYSGQPKAPPSACNVQHLDAKNCSHTGDYVVDETSLAEGRQYYDDTVFYRTWIEIPHDTYPAYCYLEMNGNSAKNSAPKIVQEGSLVKVCNASAPCQWLMCHDGALVSGMVEDLSSPASQAP